MELLNNSIMSDQSRMVAFYENLDLDKRRSMVISRKTGVKIRFPIMRRTQWYDFTYRNWNFSMLLQTGDVLLFSESPKCPAKVVDELKGCFHSRA